MSTTSYSTSIKAGAHLIQTLSASLYKNAYYVLDELLSNSYDADATKIAITISSDKITIHDNGEGMDKEGLDNYLWLGYSAKQRDRKTRRLKRHTIGKFGIGKLSMHVICDRCKITTIKNGVSRFLTLNFDKILSRKGLSEEKIKVVEDATLEQEGTTVELTGLKKTIDAKKATRRIARNMPLSPDFQVVINGNLLKPEDIIKGSEHEIELDLPQTGEVKGKLIHSDTPLGEFAGIYIKVYGRTVNADDPNIFDLMNTIARPGTFIARLYGVISADGLDDIVLATRNGFKEDSLKFVEFRNAVLKRIREITGNIQKSHSREELEYERKLLEDVIRHQIQAMLKGAELPEDFLAKYSKRPDAERVRSTLRKVEKHERQREKTEKRQEKSDPQKPPPRIIRIGRKRFRFELAPMGREAYECILDDGHAVFYINTDHPQYLYSRREGSLAHHFRRVVVFEIARAISGDSASEFVNQYEGMMLQDIEIQAG